MGMGFLAFERPRPGAVATSPAASAAAAAARSALAAPPAASSGNAALATPFLNPFELLRRAARAPVDVAAEGVATASQPMADAATAVGKSAEGIAKETRGMMDTANSLANKALISEGLLIAGVLVAGGLLIWGLTRSDTARDVGKALALRKLGV